LVVASGGSVVGSHRTVGSCTKSGVDGATGRRPHTSPSLTRPNLDPQRPWLLLLPNETQPKVLEAVEPVSITWSSFWKSRPDAVVHFDLPASGGGTDLRWTLRVDSPLPGDAQLGHLRKRLNVLINANLRYSFGQ
jgi:hypothetical protein